MGNVIDYLRTVYAWIHVYVQNIQCAGFIFDYDDEGVGEATLKALQATNYFTLEEVELQQSYSRGK